MGDARTTGGIFAAACLATLAALPAMADPVTITDMTGRTIKLDKPAERLVVFPVPWASTVIALDGGADKLLAMHPESKLAIEEGVLGTVLPRRAGHSRATSWPAAPRAASCRMSRPIAALKPDLVIQWGNRKDDGVAPLANAGINTAAIVYGAEDNARQIMALVATAMGRTDKLDLLMQWRDDTAKIVTDGLAGLAERDKPKVAYFFYTTPEFQTEGKGSYMDWQINLAGGINAAHEVDGWGAVGLEQIAAWDPDVILLGSFEPDVNVSRIYDDPILGATKAAKANRVYKVPVGGYRWDPPSQDSPLMWMWLASLLHPDRFDFDLRAATTEWYVKIYGHEPTADQLDAILLLDMNAKGAGLRSVRPQVTPILSAPAAAPTAKELVALRLSGAAWLAVLAALLLAAMLAGICLGRLPIAPAEVFDSIAAWAGGAPSETLEERIVLLVRAPRVVIAVLSGMGLAMAGAALQGLFRNPLVSPDILGITAGAAFGGALAILHRRIEHGPHRHRPSPSASSRCCWSASSRASTGAATP